ncbi:uncharacterized protein LOC128221587 [Mya arenaria]|uniref:uncharacterized protein LOC128221587 n=1 Tax=Mya arenaria TaxID=6604 RepID=UPI0022E3C3D1|nr:uncharacterized protein LOC128221587 [Mya arenaria]
MTAFYLSTDKNVKDAVKAYLPPTKEMAKTCRINIATASRQEMEFLRSVRAHYDICYMCDDFEENCTTVGICPKSSSCYRGESHDIRLWPTLTGEARLLHPPAVTHGCCDTSKSHCRSGTHLVYDPNNSKLKRANYTMSVCSDSYPVPCNSDHTSAQSNFSRLLATHFFNETE